MQNKTTPFQKLNLHFKISLGIFLFVLFFRPFGIEFEFESVLIFLAGLGGITFILMGIMQLLLPLLFPNTFDFEEWKTNPDLFSFTMIFVLNTVAYAFYIRYVGQVPMTFFMVFRIALISILPLVVLQINKDYKNLKKEIHALREEGNHKKEAGLEQKKSAHTHITFFSDNRSEKLEVLTGNILLISSADNYIKIIYSEDDSVQHKLIRNTLKNAEELLKHYPGFFRCHRTCIVNKAHVAKLSKSYKGYRLKIENYEEEIPVSRQYILKAKELIGGL